MAIKKRLMQISVRLDDHIYKNNLISVENAEIFIQEIATLKHQCYGDVPSLQVVEKLTRIMRAITVGEGSTHNDDNVCKPRSPAVSSPGIDSARPKHIMSQYQETNNQNNTETVESIALESTITNYDDGVETAIATVSDITEFSELIQNVDVEDITRVISTLSVHGSDNAITNDIEKGDELSLNLLDNHGSLGDLNNCGQGFKDTNGIADVFFEIQFPKGKEFTGFESNASEKTHTNDILDTNNYIAENLLNDDLTSCGQGFEEYEKALKSSNLSVDAPSKTMTQGNIENVINASVKADKRRDFSKKLVRPKSEDTKKQNKKNKNIQNQKPRNRKTKILNPKKAQITNNFDRDNQPQPDPPKNVAKKKKTAFLPPIKEPNNKESTNSLPTQFATMEIDLSWVETLKFVRQITEDEYSSMNGLNESFWKNCEFPPNFDENDFNYS